MLEILYWIEWKWNLDTEHESKALLFVHNVMVTISEK